MREGETASSETVFSETVLFIGGEWGYISLREWVGVWGMDIHAGNASFAWRGILDVCWTCPYRERGS